MVLIQFLSYTFEMLNSKKIIELEKRAKIVRLFLDYHQFSYQVHLDV